MQAMDRLALVLLLLVVVCASQQVLLESWRVQTSQKISSTPQQISTRGFDDSSWYPASVPANGTIMAVLLQNNVYEDILYGDNMLKVPLDQFNHTWWYRTQFLINNTNNNNYNNNDNIKTITFKGINYKANIWINGEMIGDISTVAGPFRYFTFDVSDYVSEKEDNALALEIYKPINKEEDDKNVTGLDLAITFVDWAAPPPDSNMGLWQEVVLSTFGAVTIDYPHVNTNLLSLSPLQAQLTILAELTNFAKVTTSGILSATIPGLGNCSQSISLSGNSVEQVFFVSSFCKMLLVDNPNLWWPAQMGTPYLYSLTLDFKGDDGSTFTKSTSFGIREITGDLDNNNHKLFKVNGKNLLIRGAGWSPDLFQRTTPQRQEIEMKYVMHLGLNTIRLEGKFENDNLFNLADQYGILMLPGICCCDAWQAWDQWDANHYHIAEESIRSQVKRLRIHPSILAFMYSSDMLPPIDVEKMYLSVFASEFWDNPLIASADKFVSNITGPTGVKMSGPYSWVPPNYWLLDTHTVGGAFGFLTEGGPGEAPLTFDSFTKTIPEKDWWPINSVWDYHCGAWYGNFFTLEHFTSPLDIRYGVAGSAQDYSEKSQLATYEGQRAMFEGYSRNKYTSTGVIQWMLNNAFSEMIWHLYDIYLVQGGGYYASKKACEPLHILYSYSDASIWVVNSMYEPVSNLFAVATIYNIDATIKYNTSSHVPSLSSDGTLQLFTLPSISGLSSTYFLKLSLYNNTNNEMISDNFYWLSTAQDVLDFANSTWFNTPCTSYADYTLLNQLPLVQVESSFTSVESGDDVIITTTVKNPSASIAFFIRLQIVYKSNGDNIVPIFWDDNYFSLLPYETRNINVSFSKLDLGNDEPELIVSFYNQKN